MGKPMLTLHAADFSVYAFKTIVKKFQTQVKMKQLSEICKQKILDVIINHLRIRKTIIGKWVMSLPEWLEQLQVSLWSLKYPDE